MVRFAGSAKGISFCAGALGLALICSGAESDADKPSCVTESLRGRVVWMAEALERRFGVSTVREAREKLLAVETKDGRLWPIVENVRGRAFRLDPRLRELDVDLLVRRYADVPMVQVIRVYAWENSTKYEVDYWCDICAIPMYELKDCECCQGPIVLRKRAVSGKQ